MCKDCECGEHNNIQSVTEQDLAQQFQSDTGSMPNLKPDEYRKWLERRVINQQNHRKVIKSCNDEINKVMDDDLNE